MSFMIVNDHYDFDFYGIIKNLHFRKASKEIVDYANGASVVNANEMIISNDFNVLTEMENKYRGFYLVDL